MWWLVALKRIEKIILESGFDQKKKKPGLKSTFEQLWARNSKRGTPYLPE